jgi:hypothetical protein
MKRRDVTQAAGGDDTKVSGGKYVPWDGDIGFLAAQGAAVGVFIVIPSILWFANSIARTGDNFPTGTAPVSGPGRPGLRSAIIA